MIRKSPTLLIYALLTLGLCVCAGPEQATPGVPEPRFLTGTPGIFDVWPAISPDGSHVLFCRSGDLASFELMLVPIAGGDARPLIDAHAGYEPTRPNWHWATDRILFTSIEPNGETTVRMIDAEGAALDDPHTDDLGRHTFYPCWSRDGGSYIVTEFDSQSRGVIKRVTLETGEVEALTDPDKILAGRAWESPDGDIVFAGQFNDGRPYDQTRNMLLRRTAEGRIEQVTQGVARAPSYSPDGRWIAYESPEGGRTGQYAVFVRPAQGGEPIRISEYNDAQHPLWTPDGRSIVCFMRLEGGEQGFGLAVIEGFDIPGAP